MRFLHRLLPCPHCGQPGISVLRKLFLGPMWPTRCQACQGLVSVPWWSALLVFPALLALNGARALVRHLGWSGTPGLVVAPDLAAYLSVAAVLLVALTVVSIRWIPLVRRR